jgi:hypothetical protein
MAAVAVGTLVAFQTVDSYSETCSGGGGTNTA